MSKYEYIIVNSHNEWLDTIRTKAVAIYEFNEHKKKLKEENDDTTIYLYKAEEIKRYEME